jgi:hypothetical protein
VTVVRAATFRTWEHPRVCSVHQEHTASPVHQIVLYVLRVATRARRCNHGVSTVQLGVSQQLVPHSHVNFARKVKHRRSRERLFVMNVHPVCLQIPVVLRCAYLVLLVNTQTEILQPPVFPVQSARFKPTQALWTVILAHRVGSHLGQARLHAPHVIPVHSTVIGRVVICVLLERINHHLALCRVWLAQQVNRAKAGQQIARVVRRRHSPLSMVRCVRLAL